MFKKHDYSSSYFKKGDMSHQTKRFGNFNHANMVHPFIRADDFDLKAARKAGNILEKKH